MATREELLARMLAASANKTVPLAEQRTPSAEKQEDKKDVVFSTPMTPTRIFHHPTAGSTTIMPTGQVIAFAGPIIGEGEKRVVGEGHYETSDPDEIKWLESVAKMRGNQVTEIVLAPTGEVVGIVTSKAVDPSIAQAAADAAANGGLVVDPNDKNFTKGLVTGTAIDSKNGTNPLQPDRSLQTAIATQLALGDQSKTGTIHNPDKA